MSYKCSICYPDRFEIEYNEEVLSAEQVKYIALNYPWESELKKLKNIPFEQVNYNPSIDFTNQNDNHSFCLTAEGEPDNFSFSVWYNRPKMKKVLFGFLGEKEKLEVIDKNFSQKDSYELLDKYLARDYNSVENEMAK
jgi:hypothetical protein